jgi:hypothetical protein
VYRALGYLLSVRRQTPASDPLDKNDRRRGLPFHARRIDDFGGSFGEPPASPSMTPAESPFATEERRILKSEITIKKEMQGTAVLTNRYRSNLAFPRRN